MASSPRYSDISLAFTVHPIRHDITKLTDEDAIKASVKNLVLTRHYERPFHPEIGCNVTAMLFENATVGTAPAIERSITDVINNFEPRVKVKKVKVNLNPGRHDCEVWIEFYIKNFPRPITLNFIVERLR